MHRSTDTNGSVSRLLLPLALLALSLASTACGGDDDQAEVEQAVRDFVAATNARDGQRLCGELVTRSFKEQATGASGERVDRICEEQLELTRGLELELLSIGRPAVEGDRATVRTRLDIDGVRGPRVFSLEKEDGAWKLASGASG